MKFVQVLLGLALALALQTTMAEVAFRGTGTLDLVLIAVVYVALTSGPIVGLLSGSVAGLVQDSLSSGVLGIGGLAKSVVGFVVGLAGVRFIVSAALPRLLVFFLATVLHATLFMGAYVLLDLRQFPSPYRAVLWQAVGNAVVGAVAFRVFELLPGAWQRRRAGKPIRR